MDLNQNSPDWGIVKVTIGSPAAAISPASRSVLSCLVYKFSGTGCYMARTAASATDLLLPTTLATAISMPINDLAKLSFFGTAGDVVAILWRS
jgi:hypothetical protein